SIVSEKLLAGTALEAFSILVLLDSGINLGDYSLVLWKIFNNVDPKRDIVRRNGRIAIDATRKGSEDGHSRPWPDDIEMDADIVKRVKNRATELGIEEFFPR
ncbi:MAG: menaquinone biosynthesis decarboxylase, partial [Syntrophobacteraceae bacterium]